MDIDADPDGLQRDAHRLVELAADLQWAARRLTGGPAGWLRPPPGTAERCTELAAGLRADAAELVEYAERLRGHRSGLLAAEATAVSALAERAWWDR